MLSDITIGQYFPGNSILHRLDPRVKFIGTILYIVSVMRRMPNRTSTVPGVSRMLKIIVIARMK